MPQMPCSQPRCVPVNPRWSRRASARVTRGGAATVTGLPLTVIFVVTRSVAETAADGAGPGRAGAGRAGAGRAGAGRVGATSGEDRTPAVTRAGPSPAAREQAR